MVEQTLESKKEVIIKVEEDKEKKERIYFSQIDEMEIVTAETIDKFRDEMTWLHAFPHYCVGGLIKSLSVPENKNKTIRNFDYDFSDRDTDYSQWQKQKILRAEKVIDFVKLPFLYIELFYMYTNYYLICWKEDGLYKCLFFDFCRCPSGGCDGQSIELLVGVSPSDMLDLITYAKIYGKDREIILQQVAAL
jgi:hypothetical protein